VDEDTYQLIANVLTSSVVGQWEQIVLKADLGEDGAGFEAESYYRGRRRSVELRHLNLLMDLLLELRRITESMDGPGKGKWRSLMYRLQRNGEFDVEFGYD